MCNLFFVTFQYYGNRNDVFRLNENCGNVQEATSAKLTLTVAGSALSSSSGALPQPRQPFADMYCVLDNTKWSPASWINDTAIQCSLSRDIALPSNVPSLTRALYVSLDGQQLAST